MITRRVFVSNLAGGIVVGPFAAQAQQAAKIARIGYLVGRSGPVDRAFLQGLRDLGYVEGRNLVIEYRSAEGNSERLHAVAAELVALKVDVLVAPSTVAALAAKQATSTLPMEGLCRSRGAFCPMD
jgi:putative tryptophan/tyrosine transport system substrate-binding protein